MYKIETNIAIPNKDDESILSHSFVKQLSSGDSFVVPSNIKKAMIRRIKYLKKIDPTLNFITQSIDNGLRVWKVKRKQYEIIKSKI